MLRLLPIYIFIYHLPPTSRTLLLASKYTYISIHPPALLFEPLVHLCVHLRVNFGGCVSKHLYAFPSISIFIHTYRHPLMYGLCSFLCLSPSFCFLSCVSTNFIDTAAPMLRCLLMDAEPAHMPILFFYVSSFV